MTMLSCYQSDRSLINDRHRCPGQNSKQRIEAFSQGGQGKHKPKKGPHQVSKVREKGEDGDPPLKTSALAQRIFKNEREKRVRTLAKNEDYSVEWGSSPGPDGPPEIRP